MICTVSNGGQDACQGDSGGPLIVRDDNGPGGDIIVGVVSWGIGCDVLTGVYSQVAVGYDWIRSTVCATSKYPPTRLDDKPTDTPTQFLSATASTMPTSTQINGKSNEIETNKLQQHPTQRNFQQHFNYHQLYNRSQIITKNI
jgi:secreted trypsin-like serine protease